jgi:hypothetical protein
VTGAQNIAFYFVAGGRFRAVRLLFCAEKTGATAGCAISKPD